MSDFDQKRPPLREERLGSCGSWSGCAGAASRGAGCQCTGNTERDFSQVAICPLVPAVGDASTMPGTIVIVHGAIGCGGALHSMAKVIRAHEKRGGDPNPRGYRFLSTNLSETDVVFGGERKLLEAIKAADRQFQPSAILVYSTCTPSIICDDVESVCAEARGQTATPILLIHAEGYRTRIFANAYDGNFHAILNNLLKKPEPEAEPEKKLSPKEKHRRSRTVNLMNLYSLSQPDIEELQRLIKRLGLFCNTFPIFTHPADFQLATQAALTLSACPTHDDYFLKGMFERYGVPYLHGHRPIGIANTNAWLRALAEFFGLQAEAEQIIQEESDALAAALAPLRAILRGKRVMVSAGEMRTLATAAWLRELGMEVVAARTFHLDQFAPPHLDKLDPSTTIAVGTHQPFETINLLRRTPVDAFIGHVGECASVAKLGIACLPVSLNNNNYCAYKGAYDIARRLARVLSNNAFNANLAKRVKLPYKETWFAENPFKFIQQGAEHGL